MSVRFMTHSAASAKAPSLSLKSVLHGASDRANSLLDQRRRLADITGSLTPIVENAQVPLQPFLAVGARLRLAALILVARFLHGVGLRADTIGHGALFAAEAIQTGKNLRALLRQILESRGER